MRWLAGEGRDSLAAILDPPGLDSRRAQLRRFRAWGPAPGIGAGASQRSSESPEYSATGALYSAGKESLAVFRKAGALTRKTAAIDQAAARSASALSVRSQVKFGSSRPKWP